MIQSGNVRAHGAISFFKASIQAKDNTSNFLNVEGKKKVVKDYRISMLSLHCNNARKISADLEFQRILT